jgi:formate hydrogenlyase transcriptional activator
VERIPQETMETLLRYPWSVNVRELRNEIERAAILSEGSTIRVLVGPAAGPFPDAPPTTLADAERQHIPGALHQTGWRLRAVDAAATLLGRKPTTRESRIKQLGLPCPRESPPIIRGVGGLSDISGVSRLAIC